MNKTLTIFMTLLVITGITYSFFVKNKISQDPIELKSYAIWQCDNNWIGKDCWEYIYFYNDHYFIRRVANSSGKVGSTDIIETNISDLNTAITKMTFQKVATNKMIFFGNNFPEKDSVCFFGDGKHLRSLTIDEHNQFGIILELYKKTRVELYRNGKLFSKYHFYLQKNNNYNFYPLQMQSPDKEIEKTVVITNSGEIKVSVKNLN